MFIKLSFCFGLFGAVLFLDLVSFSSADEQKLIDVVLRKLIDGKKPFDEQKLNDEQKSFDVHKLIDEQKLNDEQKLIDEQKLFDVQKSFDEMKSFDQQEINEQLEFFDELESFRCKEECVPPSICIIDQCSSSVPKIVLPDDTKRTHSAYFYAKLVYKTLLLVILSLISCLVGVYHKSTPKPEENQGILQYPEPTQDVPCSVNSQYTDTPPSYDNVKPNTPRP